MILKLEIYPTNLTWGDIAKHSLNVYSVKQG